MERFDIPRVNIRGEVDLTGVVLRQHKPAGFMDSQAKLAEHSFYDFFSMQPCGDLFQGTVVTIRN
jgi:hypothetical protein